MGTVMDAVREFIKYTAPDAPYRTDPQTGVRYTQQKMGTFAEQISKQYNLSYATNPYIEPEKPALAYA